LQRKIFLDFLPENGEKSAFCNRLIFSALKKCLFSAKNFSIGKLFVSYWKPFRTQ